MAITFKIESDRLAGARAEILRLVGAVVLATAAVVEADMKTRIQTGPKTGRESPRGKRGTHIASAPGEAPATDTGNLVNSIVSRRTGVTEAQVSVAAGYAEELESGTGRIAPRPFMEPALEAAAPGFESAIASVINSTLGG